MNGLMNNEKVRHRYEPGSARVQQVAAQIVSAVDCRVHLPEDGPTIGILICKSKSNITVEYSLRDLNKPIGVSEYQITESLSETLKSSLPNIEQIEAELGGYDDE